MSLNLEGSNGGTFALANAAVATATTTSLVKTTATLTYVIDGVYAAATKAATDNIPWTAPTGFVNTTTIPQGSKCAFGLWIDSAGALTITQGPIVSVNVSTDKVGPPPNPGARAQVAAFTVFNTGVTANGGFRPGTDALGTSNTVTYFNTLTPVAVPL